MYSLIVSVHNLIATFCSLYDCIGWIELFSNESYAYPSNGLFFYFMCASNDDILHLSLDSYNSFNAYCKMLSFISLKYLIHFSSFDLIHVVNWTASISMIGIIFSFITSLKSSPVHMIQLSIKSRELGKDISCSSSNFVKMEFE